MIVFHLTCPTVLSQSFAGIFSQVFGKPEWLSDCDLDQIVAWAIGHGAEVREYDPPPHPLLLAAESIRYSIIFQDDAAAVEFKLVWSECEALVEGA